MGKTYGYARISKPKQSLQLQIDAIKKMAADAVIFSEAYTGSTNDRPEWKKLLKKVEKGDTIIFYMVSRMSRSAEEGTKDYFDLYNKGINLIFIKDRHIDTESYKQSFEKAGFSVDFDNDGSAESNLITKILDALKEFMQAKVNDDIKKAFEEAEKELKNNHKRTSDGMKASGAGKKIAEARLGNRYETKKSKEMKGKIRKMAKCYDGTMTDKEVMETLKLARNTYYKYKREIDADMQ